MTQPPPPPTPTKNRLKKYKSAILISLAIIIVEIVLFSPFIPVQYTVTRTRTRNLQYSSQLYDRTVGAMDVGPSFVNVINQDSISGNFSVSMNYYENDIIHGQVTPRLLSTKSQSFFINAGSAQTFYAPSDWTTLLGMFSFTYSVSAPSTTETYDLTQTEYKSILVLIKGS